MMRSHCIPVVPRCGAVLNGGKTCKHSSTANGRCPLHGGGASRYTTRPAVRSAKRWRFRAVIMSLFFMVP